MKSPAPHYDAMLLFPRAQADSLLVRKAGAALGTATSQHLAAVRGGHALAEAMHFGALALFRLIGTNHFRYTSCTHSDRYSTCPPQRLSMQPRSSKKGKMLYTQYRHGASCIIAYMEMACQPYFLFFFSFFFPLFHAYTRYSGLFYLIHKDLIIF